MALDLNKPITTKMGHPVRIVCTDYKNDNSSRLYLIALVMKAGGYEDMYKYNQDGTILNGHDDYTLINPKVKKEGWINVYPNSHGLGMHYCKIYDRKEDALAGKDDEAVDTIHIEWKE